MYICTYNRIHVNETTVQEIMQLSLSQLPGSATATAVITTTTSTTTPTATHQQHGYYSDGLNVSNCGLAGIDP